MAWTIGSFSSLSLEPPLVLFCLDKDANCRQAFLDSTHFAVNVLAENQSSLSSIFATKNAPRPWHELDYFNRRDKRCAAHGGRRRPDRMYDRGDP